MKKVAMILLASLFVFAFVVACGDDDDGASPAKKNEEACESLFETLEGLECVADDWDWGFDCSAYEQTTCDISEYFTCLEDAYFCDDSFDPPILNAEGATDCVDLANCE